MKHPLIIPNYKAGNLLFHCWNGTESFYLFVTNRKYLNRVYAIIKAQYGKIYFDITTAARKNQITFY